MAEIGGPNANVLHRLIRLWRLRKICRTNCTAAYTLFFSVFKFRKVDHEICKTCLDRSVCRSSPLAAESNRGLLKAQVQTPTQTPAQTQPQTPAPPPARRAQCRGCTSGSDPALDSLIAPDAKLEVS